jgi:AcrR family transcriptional regulator
VTTSSFPQEPDVEDLTARARIRDAALRLFGERGVESTTIRDIARAAGVSGGLVRHHFGSKEELRSACDSYALSRMMEIKEQAVLQGQIASPGFMSSVQPAMLTLLRYFARSMVDGSPAAGSMFDEMVDLGEDWLAEHHTGLIRDPLAYSALLVAMELGVLVMREQLSRVLGSDVFGPEGHLRLLRAKVDFYSQPLLSAGLARQAHTTLDRLQRPEQGGAKRHTSSRGGRRR